jgi:hypothetical protein
VKVDLFNSNVLVGKPIEYGGKPVEARGIEGRAQESVAISGILD